MKKILVLFSFILLTGCSNELVCTLETTEENYESKQKSDVPSGKIPALLAVREQIVKQAKCVMSSTLSKVGRNDKCPCGSGKKYKYCCGKG